jgi:hypothetical protein
MAETVASLPEALFQKLQRETFALLHTIDSDTGSPTSNAVSWIFAVDPGRLRFAVDSRSKLVGNLKARAEASVTLFEGGSVHVVYGRAVVRTERMEGVPFPLACVDLEVRDVREAMFYGARLTALPEYKKIYDQRAADRLDGQVFAALQKAQ